jgi:hypothetical protein
MDLSYELLLLFTLLLLTKLERHVDFHLHVYRFATNSLLKNSFSSATLIEKTRLK